MNKIFTLITAKSDNSDISAKKSILKHKKEIVSYKSIKTRINDDTAIVFVIVSTDKVFNEIVNDIEITDIPCKRWFC